MPTGGIKPGINAKAEENTMNEETVKQENENTAGGQEKTFTQAELDRIVAERLGRERAKYEGYEDFKAKAEKYDMQQEAAKSDLQKAQEESAGWEAKYEALSKEIDARNIRDKISRETGVPADCLTGETEEACKAQADAILKFRGDKPKYPSLQDGGEARKVSGGKTRDQFTDWFKDNFSS